MRKLNDETGVTLVELLAAIAILSIIVTAFLGFFIQAAKTNQYTNQVNEATFLAQEQMEEIIHNAPTPPATTEPGDKIEVTIGPGPAGYNRLYSVTVTVRDKPENEGGKVRAKMQNILPLNKE